MPTGPTRRALSWKQVASSPGLSIVERAGDLASAARAIRSGEAIGAVYVPADFERDLKAERRPQVVAFYNQQFLTAAGIASSSLSDSLGRRQQTRGGARRAESIAHRIADRRDDRARQPAAQLCAIPAARAVAGGVHIIVTIAAGYAVGSEFRRRSMRTWLACAGGNPIVALAGKLAPLFAIFFVIMLTVPLILEGLLGIAFKGDVAMVIIAASLFLISYLAMGALLQLLVRDLALGLGLDRHHRLAGLWLRRRGISHARHECVRLHAWAAILPLRWYMAVLFGQAARGLPLSDSAPAFAALAALATRYSLLAFLRLRSLAKRPLRR